MVDIFLKGHGLGPMYKVFLIPFQKKEKNSWFLVPVKGLRPSSYAKYGKLASIPATMEDLKPQPARHMSGLVTPVAIEFQLILAVMFLTPGVPHFLLSLYFEFLKFICIM